MIVATMAAVNVLSLAVLAYGAELRDKRMVGLLRSADRRSAALTAALVHRDGEPVASAIVQTFGGEDPIDEVLASTPQAGHEEGVRILGL